MRIERFVGSDTKAAMAQVRIAMGSDALILANRRKGNRVEITAARDVDGAVEQAAQSASGADNEIQMKSLQRELEELRAVLQRELGSHQWRDSAQRPAVASTLMKRLQQLGLSRVLAGSVADAAARSGPLERAWGAALDGLASQLPVAEADAFSVEGAVTALLGGTGVGKTSTLAKLATTDAQRFGRQNVGLINMDIYRVGAQEQLQSFAAGVGLPLLQVHDGSSLQVALGRFASLRRIYIDTTGMGQRESRLYEQLSLLRKLPRPPACQLVLSASSQPCQSKTIVERFGSDALAGAIITKVDEATRLGGIIDVLIAAQLPLLYLSDGQRIPEDIRPGSAAELVALAVDLLPAESFAGAQRAAPAPARGPHVATHVATHVA
jgi:flagellar biosynthesis protein FlhF